jgi:hypothetical protein
VRPGQPAFNKHQIAIMQVLSSALPLQTPHKPGTIQFVFRCFEKSVATLSYTHHRLHVFISGVFA